jgi:hypothetical protein
MFQIGTESRKPLERILSLKVCGRLYVKAGLNVVLAIDQDLDGGSFVVPLLHNKRAMHEKSDRWAIGKTSQGVSNKFTYCTQAKNMDCSVHFRLLLLQLKSLGQLFFGLLLELALT